jgi:acetyl-CoA carboxylase carboxyl transferase subunit alpha
VISPEGCAAILWKNRAHAQEAAEAMKLTARDLQKLNLIDAVIPEPLGGAQYSHADAAEAVKAAVVKQLKELMAKPVKELLRERYAKYRQIGAFGASKNGTG